VPNLSAPGTSGSLTGVWTSLTSIDALISRPAQGATKNIR
jgi:hypothetical protein